MQAIDVGQLSEVCGGVIQGYGPSRPDLVEVGATRMGDDVSYAGSFGGYSPSQCSALGTMAGASAGLLTAVVCTAATTAATGGIAVGLCTTLAGTSAAAAVMNVTNSCNTRSGR